MTIEEASKKYNIPINILKEYESWGLCQEVKKVMGSWQYDETDLERLSLIMTLHDLDFTVEEIEKYMKLSLEKNESECLKLLNKKRKGLLDEVHLKEKQLSRIDYLRYEMKVESKVYENYIKS